MAALVTRHVTTTPSMHTEELPCPHTPEQTFSEVISAKALRRSSLTVLETQVVAVLRSMGWQVVPVPASEVPKVMQTVNHPMDKITRHSLHGAVNILPDHKAGSYALIFIDSGCPKPLPGNLAEDEDNLMQFLKL